MARRVRLVYHMEAFGEIERSPEVLALIKAKAEAVAAACNAESSWGGYASAAAIHSDRARGTVWSYDNRNDEARDNRLVRNLGA